MIVLVRYVVHRGRPHRYGSSDLTVLPGVDHGRRRRWSRGLALGFRRRGRTRTRADHCRRDRSLVGPRRALRRNETLSNAHTIVFSNNRVMSPNRLIGCYLFVNQIQNHGFNFNGLFSSRGIIKTPRSFTECNYLHVWFSFEPSSLFRNR